MRKKTFITIFFGYILLLILSAFILKGLGESKLKTELRSPSGITVVELFTSEGCSSCPPADQLLSDLRNQNNPRVFLLAFHVDYWNYLGWKDKFSDAKYSQRQSDYSSVLHSEIYTPQMIVNGEKVFVGSDRSQASDAITEALTQPALIQIKFQSDYNDAAKIIQVKYSVQGETKNEMLNIALIENETTNNISGGENSGRTLHHVNVVRAFKTIPLTNSDGETTINFPADLSPKNASLILYSQSESTKVITGAVSGNIQPM